MAKEKNTEKIYSIVDCNTDNIKYNWNRQINRDGGKNGTRTENNNALIKCPPVFLSAIQSVLPELDSDRKIKQFICEKAGIQWSEAYTHYSDKPYNAEETKADSVSLNEAIKYAYEHKFTEAQIIKKFKSAGYTEEQLKPHFKSLQPQTTNDLINLFV